MFWKKKELEYAEGLSWFSYAVMLPDMDEDEREVNVIGNLIIKNTGTATLNNPMICIRIKPPQDVRLGGKIGSVTHTALMIDGTNTEAWHYIDDNWKGKSLETGEHWLKPNHRKQLEPGENLIFANELWISTSKEEKFVIVEGFFYCDEIKNGIAALNTITVNF
ncbi:hypothetical protein [Metabacillus sediminilitoris]|uniref:Uncharacterized protein n=1 Tax=Metabacillus sediminilitoris TaxID=2567941 RepID=A0A4S4BWW1_9BACI|nr:hypothetical protein [Metabacillus sediminilitoris]QGQ44707.1 hypothetical protein GMB29_05140 [Metabacillus sediminilitoris]THF78945.1 hypothetical protein E6W99_14590 [Metabacillus sediminilitoris]